MIVKLPNANVVTFECEQTIHYVILVGKAKLSIPSTVTTQMNLVLFLLFGRLG